MDYSERIIVVIHSKVDGEWSELREREYRKMLKRNNEVKKISGYMAIILDRRNSGGSCYRW